ncbi:MAG: hypothetical protein JO372_04840 [Solirubrobacterales bacterium]|nr:hypothetical protein [Solirubrobacterales bacterium]
MQPRGATRVLALLLGFGIFMLPACGASHPTNTSGTSSSVPAPRSTRRPGDEARGRATVSTERLPAPPAPPGATGAARGDAQRVPAPGTTLVVRITSVIDPLRGSGAELPPA